MKSIFTTMIEPDDLTEALTEYFAKRGIVINDIALSDENGEYFGCDAICCTAVSIDAKKAVKK